MSRLRPYINWTNAELKEHLVLQVLRLDVEDELTKLWLTVINEAFDTDLWSPIEDYNGCTMLQDHRHPDPACFVHDYMWICGYGGIKADRIFKALMVSEGMSKGSSRFRWFAVRTGWIFYYYWKYTSQRELKPLTNSMNKLHNYIKANF